MRSQPSPIFCKNLKYGESVGEKFGLTGDIAGTRLDT